MQVVLGSEDHEQERMFWVSVEPRGQGSEKGGGDEFLCAHPELEML